MNRFINAIPWLVAVALIGAGAVVFLDDLIGAPDTPEVTPRKNRVNQDEKLDHNDAEEKNSQGVLILGEGDKRRVKITSITLTPGKNHEFDTFDKKRNEQIEKSIYKYVDFVGGGRTMGVVADEKGKLVEGPGKIKIYVFVPFPADANSFPLVVEGNLKPKGTDGMASDWHWAVKVKAKEPQALLKLSSIHRVLLRSETKLYFVCRAFKSDGTEETGETGVSATVRLYQSDGKEEDHMRSSFWPSSGTTALNSNPDILPAEPTSKNWILRATPNASNHTPDELAIPIASALWGERIGKEFQGFDPTAIDPWIVIEAKSGGTEHTATSATLKLDASILDDGPFGLRSLNENVAIFAAMPATAENALTDTDVIGKDKGVTELVAETSGPNKKEVARVNVSVKERKTREIRFYYVSSTDGNNGSLGEDVPEAWRAKANELWTPQAIVEFTDADPLTATYEFSGNLGANPSLKEDVAKLLNAPQAKLKKPNDDQIFIYVIGNAQEEGYTEGNQVFIRQNAGAYVFAHELGHALGFVGHAEATGDLMYSGHVNGLHRIRKWQADIVNPD